MRLRIRTVKPEMRQDERYGRLSYPARELFNGLITMADDEGRFRAPASLILGHVFPFDDDAPRKLRDWVAELKTSGMVVFYVVDGVPYGAFRHWKRHQRVNRPNPSELPPPPDLVIERENSVNDQDRFTSQSVINHDSVTDDASPHAQARGPLRSLTTDTSQDKDLNHAGAQNNPSELPMDFPATLQPHLDAVLRILQSLAERHRARAVEPLSVAHVIQARPRKPLICAAHDYAAWADGKAQRRRDVVAGYRNWLDRTDDLAAMEAINGNAVAVGNRFAIYDTAAGL